MGWRQRRILPHRNPVIKGGLLTLTHSQLRVKNMILHDGERFPIILHRETGLPVYYLNAYLVNRVRSKDQSSSLRNAAYAFIVLGLWADIEKIDFVGRMLACEPLNEGELDSLTEHMRLNVKPLRQRLDGSKKKAVSRRVISLGAFRNAETDSKKDRVKGNTAVTRLTHIIGLFGYLSEIGVRSVPRGVARREANKEMERMLSRLKARVPKKRDMGEHKRQGLTPKSQQILWLAVEPDSPDNPWDRICRPRNQVIVSLIFGVGMRIGELINLYVRDIDFLAGRIHIRRLPDNPEDPRLLEPNAKTQARSLKVSDTLLELLQNYLFERDRHRKALRHGFLIVNEVDGGPLSLDAASAVFKRLRTVTGLPADLSAHVGRHTWNDNLSDYCDLHNISEERERKIRCKAMGWVPNSEMAWTYTRRHTKEAADKALLAVQQNIIDNTKERGFIGDIDIDQIEYIED